MLRWCVSFVGNRSHVWLPEAVNSRYETTQQFYNKMMTKMFASLVYLQYLKEEKEQFIKYIATSYLPCGIWCSIGFYTNRNTHSPDIYTYTHVTVSHGTHT